MSIYSKSLREATAKVKKALSQSQNPSALPGTGNPRFTSGGNKKKKAQRAKYR